MSLSRINKDASSLWHEMQLSSRVRISSPETENISMRFVPSECLMPDVGNADDR
jgi:hypothetical protein